MSAIRLSIATSLSLCSALSVLALPPIKSDCTLWYTTPANCWEETLPLGNGRLGMMPDGGVDTDNIVLNEITVWSGSPFDYGNPEAATCLPRIRQLLADGHNAQAQQLMYESFVPQKSQKGGTYGSSQLLANLSISTPTQTYTDYRRWLEVDKAVAHTVYTADSTEYMRSYYVPRGYDAMIVHLSANRPASISFDACLSRPEALSLTQISDSTMTLAGNLDSGQTDVEGMQVSAHMRVLTRGAKPVASDSCLSVSGADEAWIIISGETNYWGDLDTERLLTIDDATSDDIQLWQTQGIANYRDLYGRCSLWLPATDQSALPTDKRLQAFAIDDNDPELAALYFNYGRYLLICSTVPGNLPPNLQGLWTNGTSTPWNGDYHTNINVQMNHWPVEPSGMAELHMPLVDLTERSVESGRQTARTFYGDNARGWVMHMMTNPWGYTAPGEHPSWGATNTGGAWLCAHLWQHYLYMQPSVEATEYLQRIYPVLKGAADFFLSTMIEEPNHGWLVTAPSSSPENAFVDPDTGLPVSICMGPTMDTQILTELFTNVAEAADILNIDSDYAQLLRDTIAKLPPMQISDDGRLLEWLEPYAEVDPHHRHVSHLYGLHPSNQISVDATPELAAACRNTLDTRGDEGTGWSRAWKINFWARLHDGDRAYKLLRALLTPAWTPGSKRHSAGTFPNLFCSHPPVQLDGNWGGTSGIIEMLLQYREADGDIAPIVLPALPSAWTEGSFCGLRLPGGKSVDCQWQDGKIVTSRIN